MLGRWGYLPLAAVGDTVLVQPGCSPAWTEDPSSSAGTTLKVHRVFHQKDHSTFTKDCPMNWTWYSNSQRSGFSPQLSLPSDPQLGCQTQLRLPPWSPQILAMQYQNKDFPFQREAEYLYDSHAPCLTSTGTPLGCCCLCTLIQQNHDVSQSHSLGILSLVFTSVVREEYKWCLLHGGWSFCHPALGCWMRKVGCCL